MGSRRSRGNSPRRAAEKRSQAAEHKHTQTPDKEYGRKELEPKSQVPPSDQSMDKLFTPVIYRKKHEVLNKGEEAEQALRKEWSVKLHNAMKTQT